MQYWLPSSWREAGRPSRRSVFFGAVIYEMLTGNRAFDGQSQASVIAQIYRGPPHVSELIPTSPSALDRIVKHASRRTLTSAGNRRGPENAVALIGEGIATLLLQHCDPGWCAALTGLPMDRPRQCLRIAGAASASRRSCENRT